jgi:hypothetical protein
VSAAAQAAARSLPTPAALARMLSDLLGRRVDVTGGKAAPFKMDAAVGAGLYAPRDDSGTVVCVVDLELAVNLGAALALFPAAVAAESLRNGKPDEALLENFREVLNVTAGLLNTHGGTHLVLREVQIAPPALPEAFLQLMAKPASRLDVEVRIAGYGGGKMSMLA